jgi:hypothetical protein
VILASTTRVMFPILHTIQSNYIHLLTSKETNKLEFDIYRIHTSQKTIGNKFVLQLLNFEID